MWKLEPAGLAGGLDVECERKRGIRDASGKNFLMQRAVLQLKKLSLDAVILVKAFILQKGLLSLAYLPNKL